jgi:hypothetical protein
MLGAQKFSDEFKIIEIMNHDISYHHNFKVDTLV